MNSKGLTLAKRVKTFEELQGLINEMLKAGILRCLSPQRMSLCDNAATVIFYQDEREFYPCCPQHRVNMKQWAGSTRFRASMCYFSVIPELGRKWIEGRPDKEEFTLDEYEREA